MLYNYNMPAWIMNPLNEVDYEAESVKLELARQAKLDQIEAKRQQELQQAEELRQKELAMVNEKAKQKTHEMQ